MRFAVKPWLVKIWHAPEHVRLLDPLPPAHRRGIIASIALIVVCFLWPAATPPVTQPQRIPLASQPDSPLQANLVVPSAQNNATDDAPQTEQQAPPASQAPTIHENDIEHQWRTYRIAPGQTMAQLFRDNNLPPTDVYAMAQVEGNDKPLSNLQTGQTVHIRENANGVVTGLSIESDKDNSQVRFIRQPDGRFILER